MHNGKLIEDLFSAVEKAERARPKPLSQKQPAPLGDTREDRIPVTIDVQVEL